MSGREEPQTWGEFGSLVDSLGSTCLPSPAPPPSRSSEGEAWVNTLLTELEPLPPDKRELAMSKLMPFVATRRPDLAPLLLAELERRRSAEGE